MEKDITIRTLQSGVKVATVKKGSINDVIKMLGYNTNEMYTIHVKNKSGDYITGIKRLFEKQTYCIIERNPLADEDIALLANNQEEEEDYAIDGKLQEAVTNKPFTVAGADPEVLKLISGSVPSVDFQNLEALSKTDHKGIRQSFLEDVMMQEATGNQLQGNGYIFY